jgi:hypothetical protein
MTAKVPQRQLRLARRRRKLKGSTLDQKALSGSVSRFFSSMAGRPQPRYSPTHFRPTRSTPHEPAHDGLVCWSGRVLMPTWPARMRSAQARWTGNWWMLTVTVFGPSAPAQDSIEACSIRREVWPCIQVSAYKVGSCGRCRTAPPQRQPCSVPRRRGSTRRITGPSRGHWPGPVHAHVE